MRAPKDYDLISTLSKLGQPPRGPAPGDGHGPGVPWRGVVERTPCLWVTWLVQASKALGRPVPAAIYADGKRVELVPVQLTFGLRYYFVCPGCGRRCETLFFLPAEVGCRKCLHLGYASQMARPMSVWRLLDTVFDRRAFFGRRYEGSDNPLVLHAIAPAQELLRSKVMSLLARVEVADGK